MRTYYVNVYRIGKHLGAKQFFGVPVYGFFPIESPHAIYRLHVTPKPGFTIGDVMHP